MYVNMFVTLLVLEYIIEPSRGNSCPRTRSRMLLHFKNSKTHNLFVGNERKRSILLLSFVVRTRRLFCIRSILSRFSHQFSLNVEVPTNTTTTIRTRTHTRTRIAAKHDPNRTENVRTSIVLYYTYRRKNISAAATT